MGIRKLERYLPRFAQANILVLGDLILDHYIWGRVHRVSPEAPVPVVHVESETRGLGGAANVYQNITALGGQAELCGVVGSDEGGRALLNGLGARRRGRGGVIIDAARPTTRKTRILANSQQVVRFDVEERQPISATIQRKVQRYVTSRLPEISCLVVSDYAKGVVTGSLMTEIQAAAERHRVPVIVDPKVAHVAHYHGVTVITPNYLEACHMSGLVDHPPDSVDDVGAALQQRIDCHAVLITRGEHGMSLYARDAAPLHIPSKAQQVFDVTGAGDTVVSTLALAVSTGVSMQDAAFLANQAAGIVVGKVGTASITQADLKKALRHAAS